jgi:hypothetical protein
MMMMMMMMIMMMIIIIIINMAERDASVPYNYYEFKYVQNLCMQCVKLVTF